MNKNNTHKGFFIVLAGLVVVLLGSIFYQEYILSQGERVILQTRPVDPRDIFRGDFVVLGYEAVDAASGAIRALGDGVDSRHAYIVLDSSVVPAIFDSVVFEEPSEGLYVKSEVVPSSRWSRVQVPNIEQYYVPENTGRVIERMRGEVRVEVSIKNGEARIVRLLDAENNELVVSE